MHYRRGYFAGLVYLPSNVYTGFLRFVWFNSLWHKQQDHLMYTLSNKGKKARHKTLLLVGTRYKCTPNLLKAILAGGVTTLLKHNVISSRSRNAGHSVNDSHTNSRTHTAITRDSGLRVQFLIILITLPLHCDVADSPRR